MAAEIGLRLPHSDETLNYLKRENLGLYFLLQKIESPEGMKFADFMILEYPGYYSCPLCGDLKRYAAAFGYARKHFESHMLEIEEILKLEKKSKEFEK